MTNVPISSMHAPEPENNTPKNPEISGNSSHTRRNCCVLLTMLCIGLIFGSSIASSENPGAIETPRVFMPEGDLEVFIRSPQGQALLYDQGCYDTFEYNSEVFAKLKNSTELEQLTNEKNVSKFADFLVKLRGKYGKSPSHTSVCSKHVINLLKSLKQNFQKNVKKLLSHIFSRHKTVYVDELQNHTIVRTEFEN